MNLNKINFIFCRLIWLFLLLQFLFACQSTSPYERHPGLFQKPFKEEKLGSIHIRTFTTRGGAQFPFCIIEINGQEIPLKNSSIRYASICYECAKTGSEAVGFQLYSSDERLRGHWVLQIKNKEHRYFHLNSSNGVESSWRNTNYGFLPTFNAELGNCIPDECNSYASLTP